MFFKKMDRNAKWQISICKVFHVGVSIHSDLGKINTGQKCQLAHCSENQRVNHDGNRILKRKMWNIFGN